MNWILCGFKGCGKTHFAKKLGLPFLDTDRLLEERVGLTVREIAQCRGFQALRELESDLLASLQITGHIIAIGGGTLLSPLSVSYLKTLGKVIFLNAPKNTIRKRLLTPPLPTFLDLSDPIGSFEKMWSTRITEYERICDFQLNLDGKSDEQVLEELWAVINLEISFGSQRGANLTARPLES